jgi:hypothetical protein
MKDEIGLNIFIVGRQFAEQPEVVTGRKAFAAEFPEGDEGKAGKILEMNGMGVPGREYIQGKPVVQKVFDKIKSEFVDAPAGVGYKCNTLFYGHRAANLPIVCFFSKMSVGEGIMNYEL